MTLALLVLGPGCPETVQKIQEECHTPGAFDISGAFTERYNCSIDMDCVEQDVSFQVVVAADPADTDPSNGNDYTFSELGGPWEGAGTLCGATFAWNAGVPGIYNETGLWHFTNGGDTFTKTSQYTPEGGGPQGLCTGAGSRTVAPAAPAAIGGCPSP